jgi:hypothetical protein
LTDFASAVEGTYARIGLDLGRRLAEMLIPCLQELVSVLLDQIQKNVQFASIKPVVRPEGYGIQPEFRLFVTGFDVDVWRFSPFVAEEKKAIGSDSQDCGNPAAPFVRIATRSLI